MTRTTFALAIALGWLPCGMAVAQTGGGPLGPVGLTLTPVLEAYTTFSGQAIRFPQGETGFTGAVLELAPGGQVGRHMHPVPTFVYILEGTLSIEMEGHGTHSFSAGQALAEVTHTWHNGRNLGSAPMRFLVVFAGQKGTPNLIRP